MRILMLLAAMYAVVEAPIAAAEPAQFRVDLVDGQSAVGRIAALDRDALVLKRAIPSVITKEFRSIGDRSPTTLTGEGGSAISTEGISVSRVRRVTLVSDQTGHRGDDSRTGNKPTVSLELVDGSRLKVVTYEVTKGVAHLKLSDGELLDLPTKWVGTVQFSLPDVVRSSWPELPKDQSADLIIVKKKEGTDLVEGVAGDVSTETVQFGIDGENIPVKMAKVAGLVYFHSAGAASLPSASCVISDADGLILKATAVSLSGDQLRIVTTFGAVVTRRLDAIRSIDYSAGLLVYLSDLPAASVDWTPPLDFGKANDALGRLYQPHLDKSLDGGPLRLANKAYGKGLALSSRTRLVYKIAGQGKRLLATAGIDDAVRDLGSVELTIRGDGRKLYEGKVTGHDKPVDLDLDVADVKKLEIVVDFANGLGAGNYLDLCDARIVK